MNTVNTRWNRHALRLLGTGLIAAMAGGAMLTAEAAPPEGGPRHAMTAGGMHGGGMGGPMMGGAMGGRMGERMLDAVNATPEQRTQIKTIMDAAHQDMAAQRDAGRTLHDQMRQAFTQPTVDARTVESLRQQQLALHDKASARRMQAMLDVSRVLTPEQRAKAADLMNQRRGMMERRGQPPR